MSVVACDPKFQTPTVCRTAWPTTSRSWNALFFLIICVLIPSITAGILRFSDNSWDPRKSGEVLFTTTRTVRPGIASAALSIPTHHAVFCQKQSQHIPNSRSISKTWPAVASHMP
ncbi:hypothetical protein B0H10DRAFT_1152680 [Mycena sp. CBHHK59/15]|nr:hypothetical protein B0H10DRAFT_1152680 [Mycena sp. CBHHK59/15]